MASQTGLTSEELNQLDWRIDQEVGNDGTVYGYIVYFAEGSDSELMERATGLANGRWVQVGFPPEEEEPEQPK